MNDETEKALQALTDLGQMQEQSKHSYELENDDWWESLTEKEREDAFYAVCKRIHKAELVDHGTFRWALYDVFGFSPGMYGRGMDCGFMAIHNAIFDGEELQRMSSVERLEVIDKNGRTYVTYLQDSEGARFSLQDNNKTLKIFIDEYTNLEKYY